MSEPKKATYQVIDEENQVRFETDNLDKAVGVVEFLDAEGEAQCRISQVILV